MSQHRRRITIMDGYVDTFAQSFTTKPGIFGELDEPQGPYEVSASRNAVIVHAAHLVNDDQVEEFIAAVRKAQLAAQSNAIVDRGNYFQGRSTAETGDKP